jgi:hypothetical protein
MLFVICVRRDRKKAMLIMLINHHRFSNRNLRKRNFIFIFLFIIYTVFQTQKKMYVIENKETKKEKKMIYVHINMQYIFDVCLVFVHHLMLKINKIEWKNLKLVYLTYN